MEPEHLFRSFDFLLKNLSLSSLWGLHYVAGAQAPTANMNIVPLIMVKQSTRSGR